MSSAMISKHSLIKIYSGQQYEKVKTRERTKTARKRLRAVFIRGICGRIALRTVRVLL
ncbi:MAG: hypothetical protein KJ795_12535 [Gammaproteobacteria bacterium]|nr:hypothetical protein [Gammaproteobacteria bacterium]MBU1776353.1 hypothetical protein [Gammaproteobacteria bacterium]